MKANELMIGDWICYKGRTQIPARVLSFNNQSVRFDNGTPQDWLSSIENFEPIPITAKVLERNGFKECANGDWTNDNVDFILYRRKDGIFRIQNTNMTLSYVSSLQHALRLCGIEKEIEL